MSQSAAPDSLRNAAVRKIIYELAGVGKEEFDATDVEMIDAARMAVENVEELTDRVAELEEQVDSLKNQTADPAAQEYQHMNKDEKVRAVREKIRTVASRSNGKAAMGYKDVIQLFDGHPSPGHAYNLMESAGLADGYHYGENRGGEKRLRVNLRKTDD